MPDNNLLDRSRDFMNRPRDFSNNPVVQALIALHNNPVYRETEGVTGQFARGLSSPARILGGGARDAFDPFEEDNMITGSALREPQTSAGKVAGTVAEQIGPFFYGSKLAGAGTGAAGLSGIPKELVASGLFNVPFVPGIRDRLEGEGRSAGTGESLKEYAKEVGIEIALQMLLTGAFRGLSNSDVVKKALSNVKSKGGAKIDDVLSKTSKTGGKSGNLGELQRKSQKATGKELLTKLDDALNVGDDELAKEIVRKIKAVPDNHPLAAYRGTVDRYLELGSKNMYKSKPVLGRGFDPKKTPILDAGGRTYNPQVLETSKKGFNTIALEKGPRGGEDFLLDIGDGFKPTSRKDFYNNVSKILQNLKGG